MAGELHDETCNIVLRIRWKAASQLKGLIEKLRHTSKSIAFFDFGEVVIEMLA